MERLTFKFGGTYGLNDKASANPGLFTDYDGFFAYFQAINKLGKYEDAEESGRLLVLPCKVGDTVYWYNGIDVSEFTVYGFFIESHGILRLRLNGFEPIATHINLSFSKEEAEAKLKEV